MPFPKRTVELTIDVPKEVERRALERCIEADAPEEFEEFIHEQLYLDIELQTSLKPGADCYRSPA